MIPLMEWQAAITVKSAQPPRHVLLDTVGKALERACCISCIILHAPEELGPAFLLIYARGEEIERGALNITMHVAPAGQAHVKNVPANNTGGPKAAEDASQPMQKSHGNQPHQTINFGVLNIDTRGYDMCARPEQVNGYHGGFPSIRYPAVYQSGKLLA